MDATLRCSGDSADHGDDARPPRTRPRPAHARRRASGIALFGILVVNLLAFSGPSFLYAEPLTWWSGADRWLEWGVLVLAEGAFYTIFSVLFGWGFGRWIRRPGRRRHAAIRPAARLAPRHRRGAPVRRLGR
ncbi:MAG: hypothetical protein U5J97_11370 [Trueperaceae bacterium]|nr:hypothetical protein [Trueperaceae bacterium]